MTRHRRTDAAAYIPGPAQRGASRRRLPARRRRATTFEAPTTAISSSLTRLRTDIAVLVDTAARQPTVQRRAALVDVHHQLRLLGQRVNAALGVVSAHEPPQLT